MVIGTIIKRLETESLRLNIKVAKSPTSRNPTAKRQTSESLLLKKSGGEYFSKKKLHKKHAAEHTAKILHQKHAAEN